MGIVSEKIKFKNICIKYNGSIIIENISLTINQGETVCFFGPSGCGKTTLLKTILGIVHPAEGKVFVEDLDASQYNLPIAYLPQENELFRWLNVKKNVILWHDESAKKISIKNAMKPETSIEVVGLNNAIQKMPYELSGGMARRTALARCLATHSKFMFLDEAFVSIERELRRNIMVEVRKHMKKNKITGILVSHDYEEAVFMADRVIFLTAIPAKISKTITVSLPVVRNENLFDSEDFMKAMIGLVGK